MPLQKLLSFILLSCFLLCSCQQEPPTSDDLDFSHFHQLGLFFIDSTDLQDEAYMGLLTTYLASVAKPSEPAKEVIREWHYGLGDPTNGLNVAYNQHPSFDTIIELPHRINKPDWPIWYQRSIAVAETAYFYANGDDGVQCFLEGKLQEPLMGNYFRLEASNDSVLITLRVLNNALKGGLREAALYTSESFQQLQDTHHKSMIGRQLLYWADQYEGIDRASKLGQINSAWKAQDSSYLKTALKEIIPLQLPVIQDSIMVPATSEKFSFTAWGDSQGGWNTFHQIVEQIKEQSNTFSIGLGDLVADGVNENQWLAFTQCLQSLLADQPVFAVAGNHDYDGYYNDLNPLLYRKYVLEGKDIPTYFSWSYGNAFFMALDPNSTFPIGITDDQKEWMEAQMNSQEWQQADWRFILIHQPPYSQGWPGYHGDIFIREIVDSLAEAKQIDFVLSGHSHDYERLTKVYGTQHTHFFVLGGAGGGLEPPESSAYPKMDTIIKAHHFARFQIDENRVQVSAYDTDGQLLDEYLVRK